MVPASPQAVIFDYGNVLSQPQPAADVQQMAVLLDLPVQRFSEVYWMFRIAYDAGTLSPAGYWNDTARAASRELTPSKIDSLIEIDARSWTHPAPFLPQWARDLRASGVRTALLSNMPASVRDYVLPCDWLPEFDARVFSCDFGSTKPDPEIYRHCLRQLDLAAEQAVFLDDREANVRAAEALRLPSILFTDAAAASREIALRFQLPPLRTE
jgi:putative hydrolase of the HAD superfamily